MVFASRLIIIVLWVFVAIIHTFFVDIDGNTLFIIWMSTVVISILEIELMKKDGR